MCDASKIGVKGKILANGGWTCSWRFRGLFQKQVVCFLSCSLWLASEHDRQGSRYAKNRKGKSGREIVRHKKIDTCGISRYYSLCGGSGGGGYVLRAGKKQAARPLARSSARRPS